MEKSGTSSPLNLANLVYASSQRAKGFLVGMFGKKETLRLTHRIIRKQLPRKRDEPVSGCKSSRIRCHLPV
jgi:hypothetical protein